MTAHCQRCHRFAGTGHVCGPKLARCANLRCRRLLPEWPRPGPDGLCARCRIRQAIDQAAGLPANTGRRNR
jgi:hypothetical protein